MAVVRSELDLTLNYKEAQDGDAAAVYDVCGRFDKIDKDGPDTETVLGWLMNGGETRAQALGNLGCFYHSQDDEEGVDIKPRHQRSIQCLTQAVHQGNVQVAFSLWNIYQTGWSVQKDEYKAFLWLRQAALLGAAEAQYELAVVYEHGISSRVVPDAKKAAKWYRKSFLQNYHKAVAWHHDLHGGDDLVLAPSRPVEKEARSTHLVQALSIIGG